MEFRRVLCRSAASDLVEEWPPPDEAIFPCGPDHAVGAPPAPTAKPTQVWSNPALAHPSGPRMHEGTSMTSMSKGNGWARRIALSRCLVLDRKSTRLNSSP